ncbi:hypothetical protein GN956_G18650 [Arapaima gigas]
MGVSWWVELPWQWGAVHHSDSAPARQAGSSSPRRSGHQTEGLLPDALRPPGGPPTCPSTRKAGPLARWDRRGCSCSRCGICPCDGGIEQGAAPIRWKTTSVSGANSVRHHDDRLRCLVEICTPFPSVKAAGASGRYAARNEQLYPIGSVRH